MNRYNAQILNDKDEYHLQFETDSRDNFNAMEKLAQKFMDKKQKPLLETPIGKHFRLADPIIDVQYSENGKYIGTHINKLAAHITDLTDKVVCDKIVEFAKEQGITDLFLIDEEFVKSALINELSRISYKNAEKEAKENGFTRVKLDLPKLPRTNFDKITESVEAFADWIFKSYTNVPENVPCTVENCETTDRMDCKKCFIEWLQKEIEE